MRRAVEDDNAEEEDIVNIRGTPIRMDDDVPTNIEHLADPPTPVEQEERPWDAGSGDPGSAYISRPQTTAINAGISISEQVASQIR